MEEERPRFSTRSGFDNERNSVGLFPIPKNTLAAPTRYKLSKTSAPASGVLQIIN